MNKTQRMAPDLRGCELHGMAEWVVYQRKDRAPHGACLACQRALYHKRKGKGRGPYMGTHCVKGNHLKTPWTWVLHPQGFRYCKPCRDINQRERYARNRAERLAKSRDYYQRVVKPRREAAKRKEAA